MAHNKNSAFILFRQSSGRFCYRRTVFNHRRKGIESEKRAKRKREKERDRKKREERQEKEKNEERK